MKSQPKISKVELTMSVFGVRHCVELSTTGPPSDIIGDYIGDIRKNHINTANILRVDVDGINIYKSNSYARIENIWQRRNLPELTAPDLL